MLIIMSEVLFFHTTKADGDQDKKDNSRTKKIIINDLPWSPFIFIIWKQNRSLIKIVHTGLE